MELSHIGVKGAQGLMNQHLLLQPIPINEVVGKSNSVGSHEVDVIVVPHFLIVVIGNNLVGLHCCAQAVLAPAQR